MRKIEFDYSFAPPHRVTLCMPESGKKALYDALEHSVQLSWTDECMENVNPAGIYIPMNADKKIVFTATLDGNPMTGARWSRIDDRIPSLSYLFHNDTGTLLFEAAPYIGGEIIRLTAQNDGAADICISLSAEANCAFSLKWVEPDSPYNCLLGHAGAAPDRMLLFSGAPSEMGDAWNQMAMK